MDRKIVTCFIVRAGLGLRFLKKTYLFYVEITNIYVDFDQIFQSSSNISMEILWSTLFRQLISASSIIKLFKKFISYESPLKK